MISQGLSYSAGTTSLHRCDARLKIVLLLAYSVALVCVSSWWALAACAALLAAFLLVARFPPGELNRMLAPVYVMAGASVAFNVIASPDAHGLAIGLFFGLRMVLLVAASFAVCFTTPSSALLQAFSSFIGPLRRFHVPVDDIALTLALSLRFIPVIEAEFSTIRSAQVARGAQDLGFSYRTLQVWGSAFSALFVGLFRHADALSAAMDARCYGAADARTRLPKDHGGIAGCAGASKDVESAVCEGDELAR